MRATERDQSHLLDMDTAHMRRAIEFVTVFAGEKEESLSNRENLLRFLVGSASKTERQM